ncbi:dCTP deaminase [Candidatus Gracilibacteria bacterium 28_42_T64]|nr:dCTP deaminase [Candidatus Gracilibacteria bacterium 28_42_T64]
MILSDTEIRRRLESGDMEVLSLGDYKVLDQIGPASLDFRLGNSFKIFRKSRQTVIDSRNGVDPDHVETITLQDGDKFVLHPGDFVLGVTLEKIKIPYDLVARCEGRSSIGRLGVIIHSTAGFIDPGFEGTITLEMTNINEVPIALYTGMRIGQFAFETIVGEVENTYDKRKGSKYMNQVLPEESRISNDLY